MHYAIPMLIVALVTMAVRRSTRLLDRSRIVGGSATTIIRYPFVVALLRSTAGNVFQQHCGGTIINSWTIISAAHCVHGDAASLLRFRVGSTRAHSGGRVISISKVVAHPHYQSPGFNADLALLQSSIRIVFSTNVKAARWANNVNYKLTTGINVVAVGWGANRWGGDSIGILHHVQLQILDQNACIRNYAAHNLVVNTGMVCAGSTKGGRDQCQGDSGGPLLHGKVLVGVSSFGRRCGLVNFPGVNTRTSYFSTWIIKHTFRS